MRVTFTTLNYLFELSHQYRLDICSHVIAELKRISIDKQIT